jgi:hypothetical protein
LFEVYLFGIAAAVVLTAIAFVTSGAVYASNYLPFLGGINVVFNNFPVNPTTWYIGTYLHFLLLWAVIFRRVSITPSLLAGSIVFEILARAMLVGTLGGFVGYMMVPNWITVFLAGMWYGQQRDVEPEASVPGLLTVVAALAVMWAVFVPALVSERSIPFMRLGYGSDALTLAITSACVSFLYLSYTWLTFQITWCVKAPALIRVVARNTVIVFIAHMPVFYLLESRLGGWTTSRPLQAIIRLLVCFVALVIVSEVIQRIVRPRALRDRVLARASRAAAVPAEGAVAV